MNKQRTDHYGVHLASNGLWFLIQNDEQNERGLLNVKSNIAVKTHRNRPVSHSIRLGSGELGDDLSAATLEWLSRDKLGSLLLPDPRNAGRVVFVEEDPKLHNQIYLVGSLTSSIRAPVRLAWTVTLGEAKAEFRLTNVQPFIITGVTPKWMAQHGSEIAALFRAGTRPLILVGSSDVVIPREVQERLKPGAFRRLGKHTPQQLEQMGSSFLQKWFTDARKNNDQWRAVFVPRI